MAKVINWLNKIHINVHFHSIESSSGNGSVSLDMVSCNENFDIVEIVVRDEE